MENLIKLFALIFTAAIIFSANLATSDREIRGVLRERMLLARALLANVVIVPILAVALTHAFRLEGDLAAGILLAAICPGAPFGTFMAGKSRQDVALADVLTCGLTLIALATVPVTSLLIFGPSGMFTLPRGLGLLLVTVTIFLPAVLGHAVRRRFSAVVADRVGNAVNWLSFLALIAANLAAAGLRSRGVRLIGWRGSALILTIVLVAMGVGWLFGTSLGIRGTLATSTGLRGAGLAFVYSLYSSRGIDVELGVAAFSILMLVPNAVFAFLMRRRRTREELRLQV